jgi:hypothetical protein
VGGKRSPGPKRNRFVIESGSFPPSAQITQFTPTEWEEFIETCCDLMTTPAGKTYVRVKRLGGAGDGGRDIEARYTEALAENEWDLYQAKRYKGALAPTELFPDLAKVLSHLTKETYPRPRTYYICAPLNCGPDLHDLLAKSEELKKRFLSDWKAGKSGLKPKRLTTAVEAYVTAFDFSRIKEFLAKDLIEIHTTDPTEHFTRFKITPKRGDDPAPPDKPETEEEVYIAELVRMYSESQGTPLTLEEVLASAAFREHFEACRSEFYCAEGLKRFSRDIFPEEFDRLLGMIYAGIRSAIHHPKHKTGMDRYDAVIERLPGVPVTDSKLQASMRGGDLSGTCHHLVNEKKFAWVK